MCIRDRRYALAYGADAVYLAGKDFGMRTASDNFGEEELQRAVEYAHARGKRVFVTVNTMPRNEEEMCIRDSSTGERHGGRIDRDRGHRRLGQIHPVQMCIRDRQCPLPL